MQNFRKRIRIDDNYPEFFFNKIYTVIGIKYHLSVLDINQIPHFFYMEEVVSEFRLMEASKLPQWIQNAEQKLSLAIIDNAAKFN